MTDCQLLATGNVFTLTKVARPKVKHVGLVPRNVCKFLYHNANSELLIIFESQM